MYLFTSFFSESVMMSISRVCQMMTSLHVVLLVTLMSEVTSAIISQPTSSSDPSKHFSEEKYESTEIETDSLFFYQEEEGFPLSGKPLHSWMKFFSGGDDKMSKMFEDSDQTNSLMDLADGDLDMKALTDLSKGVMKGSDSDQVMTLRFVITEQEVYQFGALKALLTAIFVTSVIFLAVHYICLSKSKVKYDEKYFTV